MAVVRLDALCACDGCGKRFGVELELAADLKDHEDFEAMTRAAIHGGQANCYVWGVRGRSTVDRLSLSGPTSVQAGKVLCDACTKRCDDYPVEGNLSAAQVDAAVEGRVLCEDRNPEDEE